MSESLTLLKQKEEVNAALKDLALGEPKIEGLSSEDFHKLLEVFDDVLSWGERDEHLMRWKQAFIQQRKNDPNYLRSLLDFGDCNYSVSSSKINTVSLDDYHEEILTLLRSSEAKKSWFDRIAILDLDWTGAEISQFPLQLCEMYIRLKGLQRPQLSRRTQATLNRVKSAVTESLYEEITQCVRDTKEQEMCREDDDSHGCQKRIYQMSKKERVLLNIAFYHSAQLAQLQIEANGEKAVLSCLLKAIHKHTSPVNQCPPGNDIRIIEAVEKNGEADLLSQIHAFYANDPLSALSSKGRRQLAFRYGDSSVHTNDPFQCTFRNMGIEFPDLCFVFPSHLIVTCHSDSWQAETKEEHLRVSTGSSRIPLALQDSHGHNKNNRQERIYGDTKVDIELNLDRELCTWIQVQAEKGERITMHNVKLFGKAMILM